MIAVGSWHLGIWEISYNWKINNPLILRNLGNSPDSREFCEFVRFPDIWRIPQISLIPLETWVCLWDFGNFPNRFEKCPIIYIIKHIFRFFKEFWESRQFGNSPYSQVFGEIKILTIFINGQSKGNRKCLWRGQRN